MRSYCTIASDVTAEIEVKRSRFLCWLRRVGSEPAARSVLEQARSEHWSARHHCSAFIVGPDRSIRRSNDDGEPAGTAGAPMLQVLERHEVSDVVAVVIRYFGGTLLGAGGLVRAYSDAVAAALAQAQFLTRQLLHTAEITVPIADAGRLDHVLREHVTVQTVTYGAQAVFEVAATDLAAVDSLLAAASGGQANIKPTGEEWTDIR